MNTINFILKHTDVGCTILSQLTLDDLVNFSSINKNTSEIRTNPRFDPVWKLHLYKVWLYQCEGKGVLEQYLSQFEDVIVVSPKNLFWNSKFIMSKFMWECYRDFILLGNSKFKCKNILKKSYTRPIQNEKKRNSLNKSFTIYLNTISQYISDQLYNKSLQDKLPYWNDYLNPIKWWKKQYQFYRNLQKAIPGSTLIARNNRNIDGLVGAKVIYIKDGVNINIEIEDRVRLDQEDPYFVVEISGDEYHIVQTIEEVRKILDEQSAVHLQN